MFKDKKSPQTAEPSAVGLNQFYQWTKEDPLFTSPDFDAVPFLAVVNALEKEEKSIQDYLKVKDSLYPIAFLKDILEVNRLNKEFLISSSDSKAKDLIASYHKTVEDYQSSQQSLAKILHDESLFPPASFFLGINTRVSFGTIRDDVDRLGLNAVELKKEIDKRENCLKTGKNCQIPSDSFSDIEISSATTEFSKKDILSKEALFPGKAKNFKLFGPYLASTPCFGWTPDLQPKIYPFFVSEKINLRFSNKLIGQSLKLATTSYYKRLFTDPTSPGAYLLKSNNKWVQQTETQLYMCNDPTYETNLVELDKFYRQYKEQPLFEKMLQLESLPDEIKQAVEKGDLIEKKFFKEEEFPSDNTASNLASYYGYFYKISGEWKTKYPEIAINRDDFLSRSLEYKRKLGNMTSILANALRNIEQLRIRFMIADHVNNAYSYIYGFRSFYGLWYIAFSSSFYRLGQPLDYLEKKLVETPKNSKGEYITYQQALQSYSPEEISKWDIDNYEHLNEALQEFKTKHPDIQF